MRRMKPLILETERLRLRPLARDFSDLESLNAIQADPDHMRYYPHPFSMQETRAWIQKWHEHEDRYGYALLAVEDRATGEFLGNVGFIHQNVDGVDELELGWSITPSRARQGIASEAATACRDWAFAELEVDHLISLVRPENAPSAGVARNIGMTVWKETEHGSLGWIHLVYRIDRPTG
ncbi:MAG: hypothetical protein QOE83_2660 [Actinomycetota bacterium]|nr:hypothetical protein [Actinomycetota bacterium]